MNTNYGKTKNFLKGLKEVISYQFETYNIEPQFPDDLGKLTEDDLPEVPCNNRKDFRGEKAFTIDCEDCKDMDDAVSIIRTSKGYRLAVHIADVSTYVPYRTELDDAAVYRATSIYLPHLTVPMLPKVLSNGICSLNPGEDRNTLSVIMHLNKKGELVRSEITKGLIHSRVKGVYSEINRLLSGDRNPELMEKYSGVTDDLRVMAELYRILRANRIKRGATTEDSNKPKISVWRHSIKLTPVKEGVAENMIEEFMILANRVVAEYLYANELPAIYRVQEEKNHLAAYQPVKMHHAELVLECYSNFTSPIRRIADLKIHQIISMHLAGMDKEHIHEILDDELFDICDRATKRSRTVNLVQEMCERYCYEEYFRIHKNDRYVGRVTAFDRKNRPIILINKYNIRVIGAGIRSAKLGDIYSFKVNVADVSNEMTATQVSMKDNAPFYEYGY